MCVCVEYSMVTTITEGLFVSIMHLMNNYMHTHTQMCYMYIHRFGPLVRHWTMRYEAKHSYFKKLAQNVGNFINIPWTLAMRHQLWQCYQWLNSDSLPHDKPEVGPGTALNSCGVKCLGLSKILTSN